MRKINILAEVLFLVIHFLQYFKMLINIIKLLNNLICYVLILTSFKNCISKSTNMRCTIYESWRFQTKIT